MHANIRIRVRYILALFVLAAVPALAQPRIHIVEGMSIDWGEKTPGILEHAFTIVNVGTDTLELGGIASGAVSVTGPAETTSLGQGDSLKLTVKMETTRTIGERKGWIKVLSNDPETPFINIPVRAYAVRYMYVEPDGAILFKDVPVGKEQRLEIVMKNMSSRDITLSPKVDVSGPSAIMRVEIPKGTRITAGGSVKLNAFLTPLEPGNGECFVDFQALEKDIPVSKVQVLYSTAEKVVKQGAGK